MTLVFTQFISYHRNQLSPKWLEGYFYAVLHMGAIKSPVDAVRAAIVAEHRRS